MMGKILPLITHYRPPIPAPAIVKRARCVACGRYARRLVRGGDWATCSVHGILRVDPEVRWTYEVLGYGIARTQ